jgi:hypothetical protein
MGDRSITSWPCPSCGRMLRTKQRLRTHLRDLHPEIIGARARALLVDQTRQRLGASA